MANCKKCGVEIEDGVELCEACKAAAEETPAEAPAENEAVSNDYVPEAPKGSGVFNVGMLVWSIINLLFCCQALGIASLILTIMAKCATSPEDEAKKIKSAKICNIIGTVGGVIIFAVSFIIGFLGGIAEAMG